MPIEALDQATICRIAAGEVKEIGMNKVTFD
jgi:hypothetical protein